MGCGSPYPGRGRIPQIHPTWVGLSLPFPTSQSEEGQACRNDRGRHPRQGTDVTLTPNLSPVPQNNEKLQESPCIFALTPRQVELIRNSRCAVPTRCPPLWQPRAAFARPAADPGLGVAGKGGPHPVLRARALSPPLTHSPEVGQSSPFYRVAPSLVRTSGSGRSLWGVEQHPRPHPLDARSPPVVTTTNVPRHPQCPLGAEPPPLSR